MHVSTHDDADPNKHSGDNEDDHPYRGESYSKEILAATLTAMHQFGHIGQ
jgi:hypothetical protein